MPYLTTLADGSTPSAIPLFNDVHHNFIVANYAADGGCLDNDDGSAWYHIHHNFCVFGGAKTDFDGHEKQSWANLHIYPSVYGPKCYGMLQGFPAEGFAEGYFGNTCVLQNAGEQVYSGGPDVKGLTPAAFARVMVLGNNTIFAPSGSVGGPPGFATYQEFMAAGFDNTTTISGDMPAAATIVSWARALLFE